MKLWEVIFKYILAPIVTDSKNPHNYPTLGFLQGEPYWTVFESFSTGFERDSQFNIK